MDRKAIRRRITQLLDSCEGCSNNSSKNRPFSKIESACGGCNVFQELTQLRSAIDRPAEEKFKPLLMKGQDMSKTDLMILLENNVDRNSIRNSLKMSQKAFNTLLRDYGLLNTYTKVKEESEVSKLNLSVEEFVQLNYVEKKSYDEISKLKGFDRKQIINWKYNNKSQIKELLDQKGLSEKDAKKGRGNSVKKDGVLKVETLKTNLVEGLWKEKYESLESEYKALSARAIVLEGNFNQLRSKHTELEELNAACRSNEAELESLKEEKDGFIKQQYHNSYLIENQKKRITDLILDNKKLTQENDALKSLVKLWI
ncbi:hypothetical protein [Cytobacillus sp.]|uniref:hypothetical protein n=1 Tax=Cytobacillus sp. TaxID=2675269 RepID=UPI003517CE26